MLWMGIVLIGYRGSGKTTIGRKLADRLRQPFIDTDELVVARAGKNIKAIFEEAGEGGFRELEAAALAEACRPGALILSAGGGVVERVANRDLLRTSGHAVVYLRCEAPELLRRIHADPATSGSRPNLTRLGGGLQEVESMLARREPLYRHAMNTEIDVTRLTPEEAVTRLEGLL